MPHAWAAARALPNTTCLLSSHSVRVVQMKNCEPFVCGPQLAIDTCAPGPGGRSVRCEAAARYAWAARTMPGETCFSLEFLPVRGGTR